MFDRFIRMARARKALQEGRFEDAARLADDPLIRGDRRAEVIRQQAQAALLQRGRDRLQGGDAAGAVRDLERAAAAASGGADRVTADLEDARRRLGADREALRRDQGLIDRARRLAENGDLDGALAAIAPVAEGAATAPGRDALRAFVAARRQQAHDQRERARQLLQAERVDDALAALRHARALDAAPVAERWEVEVLRAAAAALAETVREHLRAGDVAGALSRWRQRCAALDELVDQPPARAAGVELAAALRDRLSVPAAAHDAELLQACAAEPALPGEGVRVAAAARLLQRLPGLRASGRAADLAAALGELAELLGERAWADEARTVQERAAAAGARLGRARELAAAGDLHGARAVLIEVLQDMPMHEDARAELDAIDAGSREREQRLELARQAAKDGFLQKAYGLALANAHAGAAGEEARLFAQGLRGRMDLVGRGLDEVRAALHGRTSGGVAGLRHCLLRVDELAKVQQDHDDMPALRTAITAELDGLERAEQARAALAANRLADAATAVGALVQLRPQLLSGDRLDARILELADRLGVAADRALAAGRLQQVQDCVPGLAAAAVVQADLGARAEQLRAAAHERRERAGALAAEAGRLLGERDLTGAEQRCESARQLWVDGAPVHHVEAELQSLRQQQAVLDRAEALAEGGDFDGAHQQLGDLPPTPALLRTRIFDMKQSLARAQGLDGPFLLRVDEGGEYVALRGESLTIGNLRDGTADLPVLAAIAGRHARLQRSMSFHGGMQDVLEACGGELRTADGRPVERHRLRPGDRVQLGAALQLRYQLPSKRSLTAMLQLLGAFQVAGTDRVLVFKDRGRDGRILLGPGDDVHVRVPGATGEVEIFAHKTGPMRVRCDAGGDIDGQPFRGEHPVAAGATVRAAGICFVLLPWSAKG